MIAGIVQKKFRFMFGVNRMSKQVLWSKVVLEEFISQAQLTKIEEEVMRTRVAGWTRTEQSMKLGLSLSTIDRVIKVLKIKYDNCQPYSAILPPRKNSAEELYMDTH